MNSCQTYTRGSSIYTHPAIIIHDFNGVRLVAVIVHLNHIFWFSIRLFIPRSFLFLFICQIVML